MEEGETFREDREVYIGHWQDAAIEQHPPEDTPSHLGGTTNVQYKIVNAVPDFRLKRGVGKGESNQGATHTFRCTRDILHKTRW